MKLLTRIVFLTVLFSGSAIADCPCDDNNKQGQTTGGASTMSTPIKTSPTSNATMPAATVPPAPTSNTSTTATDSTPSTDSSSSTDATPSTDTGASKDN